MIHLDEQVIAVGPIERLREAPLVLVTQAGVLEVLLKPAYASTNWVLTLNGNPVPGSQDDPITTIRLGSGAALFLAACFGIMSAADLPGATQVPVLDRKLTDR